MQVHKHIASVRREPFSVYMDRLLNQKGYVCSLHLPPVPTCVPLQDLMVYAICHRVSVSIRDSQQQFRKEEFLNQQGVLCSLQSSRIPADIMLAAACMQSRTTVRLPFRRIDTRKEAGWEFCEAVCTAGGNMTTNVARVRSHSCHLTPDVSSHFS